MPDTVLNALKSKLERYEAAGMVAEVKRVKARIAELKNAPQGEAPKLPMTLSPPAPAAVPAVLGATVSTTTVFNTNPPQSTVKKVAPKKAAKKRNK